MDPERLRFRERVVSIQEYQDGKLHRTYYCIYDLDFHHWMSDEDFEGAIWTKDTRCRREFDSRREAKAELRALHEWRRQRELEARGIIAEIPMEREAA